MGSKEAPCEQTVRILGCLKGVLSLVSMSPQIASTISIARTTQCSTVEILHQVWPGRHAPTKCKMCWFMQTAGNESRQSLLSPSAEDCARTHHQCLSVNSQTDRWTDRAWCIPCHATGISSMPCHVLPCHAMPCHNTTVGQTSAKISAPQDPVQFVQSCSLARIS
jgi:hypothetical protein